MDGSQHPITVRFVSQAGLPVYWPLIEPWVEKAVEYTAGCYLAIDIYRQLLTGDLGLWLMMDGERPIAFATTRIDKTSRRWICAVPYIGGTRLEEWAQPLLAELEGFAKKMGCDGLSGGGREGWQKYGFRKAGIWLVKDI